MVGLRLYQFHNFYAERCVGTGVGDEAVVQVLADAAALAFLSEYAVEGHGECAGIAVRRGG